MRYFPSAARQRLAVASVTGLVTLALLTNPYASPLAHADDSSKDLAHRQSHVHSQIHRATTNVDEASHAYTRAAAQVAEARLQLGSARAHLIDVRSQLGEARTTAGQLRQELADSKTRRDAATADLVAGQQAVADTRETIRDNVIATYTAGDPHLRAVSSLFGASSLGDVTSGLSAEGILVDRSNEAYDDLTLAENALAAKQQAVLLATDAVANQTHAAARQVEAIRSLVADAAQARTSVSQQVTRNVTLKQRALKFRAHDRAVLRSLHEREASIKHKILALAARETVGVNGAGNGFLDYPAVGFPITSPYGYRVHPIYGYYSLHDGDDFGIPCGTGLHAAADGTIISQYYDDVWGNRIILNLGRVNGHDMTVVYNHMSRFYTHVGERVGRGQVLGLSGTTGWSTGCHLHFTVMVDGTAVDPMKYL